MVTLLGVRETSMARNNAKNVALQLGVFRRCSSRCCKLRHCGVVALQLTTTLQRVALRCCVVTAYVAASLQLVLLWRYEWRCCCFFFYKNDSWQVQESSTSLLVRARKRETESKREQERALKLVLVLVFQAPPLSSDSSP